MKTTQDNKPSRKHPLPLYVYLCYLAVCTLLFTGVSFSSYISSASDSDGATAAAGAVAVSANSSQTVTLDNTGASVDDFSFTVSNNGGSEVAIQYDIEIQLNEALPPGVSMTLDGQSGASSGTTYTFTNAGTFAAGKSASHTHTLTFTGDAGAINAASTRNICIVVKAEQIN